MAQDPMTRMSIEGFFTLYVIVKLLYFHKRPPELDLTRDLTCWSVMALLWAIELAILPDRKSDTHLVLALAGGAVAIVWTIYGQYPRWIRNGGFGSSGQDSQRK